MDVIGIRELRQHASRYVRAVKGGATITVTERGTAVARLTPLAPGDQHLAGEIEARGLIPPTRPRRHYTEDTRLVGTSLSELLSDDRTERLG
jgi:prevent-host-death family protein